MTLREWMDEEDFDVVTVAGLWGVSVHAVKKWLRGDRTPRPKMQALIKRRTNGRITGDDWLKE